MNVIYFVSSQALTKHLMFLNVNHSRLYDHHCFVFYPTAVKGCRGIVFTHGVWMGRWAGGQREKVCPGSISETVRCRKLILGRDIG